MTINYGRRSTDTDLRAISWALMLGAVLLAAAVLFGGMMQARTGINTIEHILRKQEEQHRQGEKQLKEELKAGPREPRG